MNDGSSQPRDAKRIKTKNTEPSYTVQLSKTAPAKLVLKNKQQNKASYLATCTSSDVQRVHMHTQHKDLQNAHTPTLSVPLALSPTYTLTPRQSQSFFYLDTCRSGAHDRWAAQGGPPSASAWLSECRLWPGTEGGGHTPRWTHSPSQPHNMQNPGSFALQAERERKASYGLYQWSAGKWTLNSLATISSMHTANTKFFVLFLNNTKMCEWVSERYIIMMGACFWIHTPNRCAKKKTLHSHGPSHFCARNLHIYYSCSFTKVAYCTQRWQLAQTWILSSPIIQNTHIRYLKKTNRA